MNFCIGSRVCGLCLLVTSIAAICFATTCALGAEPFVGMKPGEERAYSALKMVFCWCPPGKFTIGSPVGEAGRTKKSEDQVDVTLTQGYWLG